MNSALTHLKQTFDTQILQATSSKDIEQLRIHYLGKKGPLQALMQEMRSLSAEDRPLFGKAVNDLKMHIESTLEEHMVQMCKQEELKKLEGEWLDITLPSRTVSLGREHPVLHTLHEILHILRDLGFSVQYSPEIESEYYNYGGLNYPEDHPARDMQDTFYLTKETLLRSHCTAIQQRIMEKEKPPIRIVAPGKCYRNETITSRSHVFFYQIDGLYIDKDVSFADLLAIQKEIYERFFNQKLELRVRPSYFPFVEPGLEIDISCTQCGGRGCSLCKHSGWLEVAGAGMVHPEVLKAGGIDPDEYSGIAWGGGVERLCMLKYGISDIRLFTQNDLRFLRQFH